MRILGLDLGTHTGWALWDGNRIESGVQDFSLQRGESSGVRFMHFNGWLSQFAPDNLRPHLLAYEKPHHRGGAATEITCGFSTRVHEFCARHGIDYCSVHTGTLKKFATGNGQSGKEAMIVKARATWGYLGAIQDDNQADALWVLEWARKQFGTGTKPQASIASHLGSC